MLIRVFEDNDVVINKPDDSQGFLIISHKNHRIQIQVTYGSNFIKASAASIKCTTESGPRSAHIEVRSA